MVGECEDLRISNVGYLPIVSAYAARIGLVDEIDRLLHCEMEVSLDRVVLAMILDALTGRSPLFRFGEFFADKDVELLLGEDIPVSQLNDDTAGRVLDRIAEVGTNVVMRAIAMQVVRSFSLDLSHAHQEVTSHKVFGDYLLHEEDGHAQPFVITEGYGRENETNPILPNNFPPPDSIQYRTCRLMGIPSKSPESLKLVRSP